MSRKNSVGIKELEMFTVNKTHSTVIDDKTHSTVIDNTTDDVPDIPVLEIEESSSKENKSRRNSTMSNASIDERKSNYRSLVDAVDELGNDTKRLYKFMKRRFSSKKKKRETEVKSIHIVQDEDENMKWASRSASSAHSRTSTGTGTSSVGSKDEDGIETVHDMDDEYNVFHGC